MWNSALQPSEGPSRERHGSIPACWCA
jgi:hypothetical protein